MTIGLLLALGASAATLDPAPLRAGLAQASTPVEAMGACAHARPRYEERYRRSFTAYVELEGAAEALFGRKPMPGRDILPASGCGERAFAKYESAAGAGLGKARQALADLKARMPGLWIGTLRICGEHVADTSIGSPYKDDSMLELNLTFRPILKAPLLAETEERVRLKMSVRIDGEAVMDPYVNEPLSAGALTLSGERGPLERIRAAALRACQASAGPGLRPRGGSTLDAETSSA